MIEGTLKEILAAGLSGKHLQSFTAVGTYGPLQINMKYALTVHGINRNFEFKQICFECVDKKWTMYYKF